jgi:hypothetical protein
MNKADKSLATELAQTKPLLKRIRANTDKPFAVAHIDMACDHIDDAIKGMSVSKRAEQGVGSHK